MQESPVGVAGRSRRYGRGLALAAVAVAAIACYAPALRAYFVLDDFTLLALARLLHEPLLAFTHDHFPGSLFFRPLGIFVWWLTTAAFDNAPRGHYAVNLALHLGCVLALYALLQRLRRNAPLNVVWTAVYAVHPLAIGTALWLSDRFDLIATTFSLLALNFAVRYRRQSWPPDLAAVLVCLLVAFAGKEIAIVGALAAATLLALPDADGRLRLRQRVAAAAAVLALTAGWLVWRHALLTNPQDLLLQPGELITTLRNGIGLWLRIGFEYLVLDPRQAVWMRVVVSAGLVLLGGAIVARVRDRTAKPFAWGLGVALFVLVFLPAPTQAPVIAVSTSDLGAQTFWFDLIGESRLYHLSLAGALAALMLLTTPRGAAPALVRSERIALAGLAPIIAVSAIASHAIAHDYASRTRAQIAPLQAAHAAIAQLALPAHACQVYLLETTPLWGFDGLVDPIIKASATAAGAQRLEHCLVMTERTSWGNFVRSGSIGPDDYRPQRPLHYRGKPVPWLELDGFEAAYLDLGADIDARAIDGAYFLEYRDGRFVDVTAAVHDGTRPVRFFNARP